MRAFLIYVIGALLVSGGLTYALVQLGVPTVWIMVSVVIVFGVAIASGAGLARKQSGDESSGS